MKLFAGLDVSTQSCKLVIINHESCEAVYTDTVIYDRDLQHYTTIDGVETGLPEGVSESNPEMWLEAVNALFKKLAESEISQVEIKSISVSGQQHGLVGLDVHGNLTRSRSKLWNDFSTQEECELLTEKVGGPESMIQEIGNTQRTGYTASKIFHMVRHEYEIYAGTTTFFLVHNYMNWYLTGAKDGGVRVMEPGDTSGMALWNPATGQWSKKVIDAIDTGLQDKLPPVMPSDKSIGTISHHLVDRYGFSPECTIDAGSGDNMYGAVGTGNISPGIVTISLGTSGTAYAFMEDPFVDPSGEIAAFCDSTGHYLPLLCVSNLANGYNALLEKYSLSHEQFIDIFQQTKAGNGGRILIPWFTGERTPDLPQASPLFFGFGLNDFTREILCRAVLEGHVLNLYDGFTRLPVTPKEIRLTGGLSQSEVWCQTIADVFETEVLPVTGEGAALGAAIHAAWIWHKEAEISHTLHEFVETYVPLDETLSKKPLHKNAAIYHTQKHLFSAISRRIRGLDGENPFNLRSTFPNLIV